MAGTQECHSRHGGRLRSPCQGAGEWGGSRPLPRWAIGAPGPLRLGARGGVAPAGGCEAPMRSPLAGACGGGNRPQRSLPAGRRGLWRGAAPPPSRAPAQSRRLPSMWRLWSATRPPTGLCPRMGDGGPPRAPPGGSGARGAVSGRTPRACAPGSPPGRRIGGTVVGGRRRRRASPYGRGACAAPACGRLWPAAPGGWWPSR